MAVRVQREDGSDGNERVCPVVTFGIGKPRSRNVVVAKGLGLRLRPRRNTVGSFMRSNSSISLGPFDPPSLPQVDIMELFSTTGRVGVGRRGIDNWTDREKGSEKEGH